MRRFAAEERRARLVERHRLTPEARANDAVVAARSLVVLHSTDAATVFLSLQARTEGVAPADIERALYEERALVRMLGMRRTLWVVPRELVPVVHAACTRTVAARERARLEKWIVQGGISRRPKVWIERAMTDALTELAARGDAFTSDLTRSVPTLATKLRVGAGRWQIDQSAGARVLPQLAMEGRIVRGRPRTSWANGQYRWTPTAAWLGDEIEVLDQAAAQAELLGHWLAAFGPATETDFRWWAGWTARETRAALALVPHETVDLDGAIGIVLAGDVETTEAREPSVALLPTLDPTTMGWKQRDWYLGPHAKALFDVNGNAGPTIWWGGRAVGGWAQRKDGEIVTRVLEDVGAEAERAVDEEAARLTDWIDDVRFSPSFLPPFQRSLGQ